MDLGVVLQTTPPSARVVDLAKTAETYGFSHVWTFDSHILWQEPYVIHSRILAETRNITVGPMVTNPATRDWTVTASTYATLNEMYGNRTVCGIGRGDSAVRVTNGAPTTLKTLREAVHVIRELANGRSVDYNGSELRFPWASKSRCEVWVAAYGPKALALTGEIGDGFILQLADPSIVEWTIKAVRDAAAGAGRNPDDITICVAAPAYVTDGSDAHHVYARDQCRWFGGMVGNHVADIVARYGEDAPVPRPTTSRVARDTTTTSTAKPVAPTPHSCRTKSSTGSASSVLSPSTSGGSSNSSNSASTSTRSTCNTTRRTKHFVHTVSR